MAREKQARGEHRDHAHALGRRAPERQPARELVPGRSTLDVGRAANDPPWELDFRIQRARAALAELARANAAGDARRSTLAARELALHLGYAREAAESTDRDALSALEREAKPLLEDAFIPTDGAMRTATRWSGDRSGVETEAARWVQLRSTSSWEANDERR